MQINPSSILSPFYTTRLSVPFSGTNDYLGIAFGDLNNDGEPDMVLSEWGGGTGDAEIYIYFKSFGSGDYPQWTLQDTLTGRCCLQVPTLGDVDGDGKQPNNRNGA